MIKITNKNMNMKMAKTMNNKKKINNKIKTNLHNNSQHSLITQNYGNNLVEKQV
jgi:hypothetical protein